MIITSHMEVKVTLLGSTFRVFKFCFTKLNKQFVLLGNRTYDVKMMKVSRDITSQR